METLAFFVLAVLALASGLVVITGRSAVLSALALALNLVSIAGLFFLLGAQFIGFLQVIVYAGAIMVLILFVIMLLNLRDERELRAAGLFQLVLGLGGAAAFAALVVGAAGALPAGGLAEPPPGYGSVATLGQALFTTWFYPFEAISLLLVVAMIGAVLLAKRRLE